MDEHRRLTWFLRCVGVSPLPRLGGFVHGANLLCPSVSLYKHYRAYSGTNQQGDDGSGEQRFSQILTSSVEDTGVQRLRRHLRRHLPCSLARHLILFRDCDSERVRMSREIKCQG